MVGKKKKIKSHSFVSGFALPVLLKSYAVLAAVVYLGDRLVSKLPVGELVSQRLQTPKRLGQVFSSL